MLSKSVLIASMLSLAAGLGLSAQQIQINADYHTRSNFQSKGHNSAKIGDGDMMRYSLKFQQPLSMKLNELYQPTVWALSVNGTYANLDDNGEANRWNPDKILNAGATVTFLTPISRRWSLMASLGAGIFAQADHIRWQTVLANGACIFAYKATPRLTVGGGAGLTNAFGPPMVMPMFFLNWKMEGKYQLELNFVNAVKATAATWFSKKFKLTWTILEMDNLMAVVFPEEKSKIYSSMMLKSYFSPEYYFMPKFSVFANAGANFVRTARISDRKIGAMFSNIGGSSYHFKPAGFFSLGLHYGF